MTLITVGQATSALIVIALILIQERSSGAGTLFGGGETGFYQRRRGLEKMLFTATIVFASIFTILSALNLIL